MVVFILNLTRTSKLNVDPLQNDLMQLIDNLNMQGHSEENRNRFSSLAAGYFEYYGITREGERQTRLAHAMSFMKLRMRPEDFRQMVMFLETWVTPKFKPIEKAAQQPLREGSGAVDVFVSYAREDKALARIIVAHLESRSLCVWWDDGLQTGTKWEAELRRQLELASAVVVLWSPLSSVSEWVRAEAAFAKASGKLVPAFLRRCRLPAGFGELQTSDLSEWTGDRAAPEWTKLLSAIDLLCDQRKH